MCVCWNACSDPCSGGQARKERQGGREGGGQGRSWGPGGEGERQGEGGRERGGRQQGWRPWRGGTCSSKRNTLHRWNSSDILFWDSNSLSVLNTSLKSLNLAVVECICALILTFLKVSVLTSRLYFLKSQIKLKQQSKQSNFECVVCLYIN